MKSLVIHVALLTTQTVMMAAPANGPLRVNKENPRYFSDGSGKAVYLTGSHTWNSLQDMGYSDPPPAFDFDAYLDFLEKHHHNFIRLWRWELPEWTERQSARVRYCAPQPWKRAGPGNALDDKPRFDLEKFEDEYFKRLRSRVEAAGKRGVYVSIMLFEGWALRFVPRGWSAHPFNPANNVNGLDGDLNHDGKGLEIYTLASPAITRSQEKCLRKVIDTVNDLDNVLYEISNENALFSTDWQYHLIRFIHEYEKSKPKQHPVGMTSDGYGGDDDTERLFSSPAEWISPSPDRDDYKGNPPPATGAKVILADTDHLWGVGGDRAWVWKSFLRGLNPIWMDPYDTTSLWEPVPANAEDVRRSMGDTRRFAERMNLAAMTPHAELASTAYCLANPGSEYLLYRPKAGEGFSVELKAGTYRYEWFDPAKGVTAGSGIVESSGRTQQFKAPFDGDTVLYLAAAVNSPKPPYPPSPVIRGIAWHWNTHTTAAPGSDLWPVTWGPDDHLYAAWGDGGGFGGTDSDGRVSMGFARIEGVPENYHAVNVNGGKNPEHAASFPQKGKTAGIGFVDGILYATINLQDRPWPDVDHALAWSADKGATWEKADWVFPKGQNFQPAKFLNFGKDYSGAPASLAGYVYICGPKQSARPQSLFLARVPGNKLREQTAYEFFRGRDSDAKPTWTGEFAQAQPVFIDTNGVTPGAMVLDPGIKRFLLTCYHTGPGQLGVFEGPEPWGPWTTIAYYEDWGGMSNHGEGLSCEFPPKWISADGLTLWSIFSVYGEGGKQGINAHDKFNLVQATLYAAP